MAGQLILNRYRLLETKGKGGFGTVDVAWDTRLQRRVAIKRIPLSVDVRDLPGIQEARTAALLNDPRIVSVLDFEVTGTEALLIMEYVDGPTLGDLLRESPELLDLDTIATIIGDVAAALDYAHENQVLHLDIKPDNILIDHVGHIKVSDFGLAQLSGTAGFAEPQGGTLGYMPPEQLTQGDVDGRTDLWALATLLYQLLTGKNPFYAHTAAQSLDRILHEPLVLPSELRPELNPSIDELIVRALMGDKQRRFTSVTEFLGVVSPWLGSTKAGRKALKYRVNVRDLDEIEFTDEWHQPDPAKEDAEDVLVPASIPFWDRLPARLRGMLARLVAALACASFAFTGLSGFEPLAQAMRAVGGGGVAGGVGAASAAETAGALGAASAADLANAANAAGALDANQFLLTIVGVVALVALGGFIVPQLGSALACIVFVAGVCARGLIVPGVVLAVLLVAWWLFCGRHGRAESTVVMLTPLLGALWMAFALPLLAGFFLPWRRALMSAAVSGLILILIASMMGAPDIAHTDLALPHQLRPFPGFLFFQEGALSASMLAYILRPLTWGSFVATLLATLVMSLLAQRGTTRWTVFGAAVATVLIALVCVVAPLLAGAAPSGFPNLPLTNIVTSGVDLALSFILLLLLSLLGVPANMTRTREN